MNAGILSSWLQQRVLLVLLFAGVIGYGAFLWRHVSPYAGGSDPSGYLNSARLLSQGALYTAPRVLPGFSAREFGEFANVPLGFILREDERMVPTYPIGYPLHLFVAANFGWSRGVKALNVGIALASGLLLYAYCRKIGITVGLALGGVALLWACPLFIFSAVQPMSDLSALGWSLVVLYSALGARADWRWGLLCGAAVGIAVLVRPTNLLLAVPLLVALGLRFRSWWAVGLGGLPCAAFFCFYSWRLYGSPLATGYGDVSSLFRQEYLPRNLAHFSYWIPMLLSPLVVLALAAPFVPAGRQRGLAVLAAWVFTLIGLYAFYYHSGETWWYLRFILPAFPALIVATLVGLEEIWRRNPTRKLPVAFVLTGLLIAAIGWQLQQIRERNVLNLKQDERCYLASAQWVQQHLPDRSVIFCMQVSGAFYYYTDLVLFRWDQIVPEKMAPLLDAMARQDRPVYAALFSFETPEALERIGGHWTKLVTVGQVTIWQRQP